MTGVVLAAGAGTRMGCPKLLMAVDGRPMVARVLELVERLPLDRRILVLGAHAEEVQLALFPSGDPGMWQVVPNPDWPEGMASSLRRAAEEVQDGILLFLGDMPWIPESAARAVLARAGDRPVAPSYGGQRGFPVYLPPSLRPALLTLQGDVGARHLLADCDLIPWPDDGVIRDADRAEDLAHA